MPQDSPSRPHIGSFWGTSVCTLVSRVLGMLRDVATASLLGIGSNGAMDAFALAFRVPDVARRLFGEGILAAAYLPKLTAKFQQSQTLGWGFVSNTLSQLVVLLGIVLLIAELIAGLAGYYASDSLVIELFALLLPYVVLASLAAQLAATLHTRLHFWSPAFAPVILNSVWLGFAWLVNPEAEPASIARWLAGGIVVGGVLQFALQFYTLKWYGWKHDWRFVMPNREFWQMVITSMVTILGLGITQLNTFVATLIAWYYSGSLFSTGAISSLYLAERLYQFPLSLIGVALATVFYPGMARSAAEANREELATQLNRGVRLALFIGIPASFGLWWVSKPLTILIYNHGAVTTADALRTAQLIETFAIGLWAFCVLPIVVRAWYALGHFRTPALLGSAALALNLILLVSLPPIYGERTLATACIIAAILQLVGLWIGLCSILPNAASGLFSCCTKSLLSSALMGLVLLQLSWDDQSQNSSWQCLQQLLLTIPAGIASYAICALFFNMPEWKWLLGREESLCFRAQEDNN